MEPSNEVKKEHQEPQEYDVTYLFLKCGAAKNKRGFFAEPRVDEHGNHGIFLKEVWKGSTAHRAGLAIDDRIIQMQDDSLLGKTNEEALERLNAPEYQNTPCRLLIMHGPRDRSVAKDDVDPSLDEIFPKNLSALTYYTPAAILAGICACIVAFAIKKR